MPANSVAKGRKWFKDKCEGGCQICGRKIPTLKNNGLEWSHIVSKKDNGNDQQINCLVLCPTCALAFDTVIKPAIFKSLIQLTDGKVPRSWENGEGRVAKLEQ